MRPDLTAITSQARRGCSSFIGLAERLSLDKGGGFHLLYELDASRQCTTSGYEIIQQQHPLALLYGPNVHLNAVLPILQLIGSSDRLACTIRSQQCTIRLSLSFVQ